MGRRSAGLLALGGALSLAAGAAPVPAAAEAPPDGLKLPAGGPARTKEFADSVERAIGRGVLWLKVMQDGDGGFSKAEGRYPFAAGYDLGLQALAVYTVRASGVPADDPVVVAGLKRMRQFYEANRRGRGVLQNYQVSLALLALEAHYAPAADADLAWIRELTAWLVAAQTPGGSFGYDSPARAWEDHSNAQFSLLALKAARRCGVEVPRAVFRRALDHFMKAQEKTGPDVARRETGGVDEKGFGTKARSVARDRARGWDYQCRGSSFPTGSMTASGVSSLVICRGELLGTSGYDESEDARVVQAVRDGLAWLGRHFSVTGNPTPRTPSADLWHYYYLYGLERAGVLAGVSWMADRDWYLEGAAYLLRAQLDNGAWASGVPAPGRAPPGAPDSHGPRAGDLMDSCFALLFLKKATFRVEGAVATEEADGALDLAGAADLDDASFAAVFDTVFARYLRSGTDRRGTLIADFVRMGTRALPCLVRRLEDEAEPARAAAIEVLGRVTGTTRGYLADAPADARGTAVAAWEEWWFSRRGRLAPDVGAGRFLER